ncbi:MAG: protein kinase [Myxococcota bacterium]
MLDDATAAELAALLNRYRLSDDLGDAITDLLVRARRRARQSGVTEADTLPSAGVSDAPQWPPRPPDLSGYTCEELIGVGGAGEVWRVYDPILNRRLALKVLRPHLRMDASVGARLLEEARLTAGLQHPNVVPVHATGVLADGRRYFTMREVSGRTLREVVYGIHAGSSADRWERTADGWSLRRLLAAFRQVCQTIAYAHQQGVLHRDLKPSNIMLGAFGEVLVLDWGLAQVTSEYATSGRSSTSGTPAFMAPEQIQGGEGARKPTADIYALGAILYQILAGRAPHSGRTPEEILANPHQRPPAPSALVSNRSIPRELDAICMRAMRARPEERFARAEDLAEEIQAWLDGARQEEQAHSFLDIAEKRHEQAAVQRERAAVLREEATRLLEEVQAYEPVARKREGWRREDEAAARERRAELLELEHIQALRAALLQAPDLREARDRLADHYVEIHRKAEMRRDPHHAATVELHLRAYDTGRYADYLSGKGRMTLYADAPGAMVQLYRYTSNERRLMRRRFREASSLPIKELSLPMGSYLAEINAPLRLPVRVPVRIDRLGQRAAG